MSRVRAFIAVPLPKTAADAIGALQEQLKRPGRSMRCVPAENIHLTLRFFGDIEPSEVPRIERAMAVAADTFEPVALCVRGMGCFPNVRKARVLWAGISGEVNRLRELHARLETALADAGMPGDGRPFKGHLTMARIKTPPTSTEMLDIIENHADFETDAFDIGAIVLYRSELGPAGARYSPLARVALNG